MSYFPTDLLDAIGKTAGGIKDYFVKEANDLVGQSKYLQEQARANKEPLIGIQPRIPITRALMTDYQKPIEDFTNKLNFKLGDFNVPLGTALRTGASFITGGTYSPEEKQYFEKVKNKQTLTKADVSVGKRLVFDDLLNTGQMAGTLKNLPQEALDAAAQALQNNIKNGITGAKAKQAIFDVISPFLKSTKATPTQISAIVDEIISSSKNGVDDATQQAQKQVVSKMPIDKGKFNVNYLEGLSDDQKKVLQALEKGGDEVGSIKLKEVQKLAETMGYDATEYTDKQIKEIVAKELKTRMSVNTLEGELSQLKASGATMEQLIQKETEIATRMRASASQGTKAALELRMRQIQAGKFDSAKEKVYRMLEAAGLDPAEYAKKAIEENLDWNDAKQVVKFYRSLVPAKFSEYLDEYRYINMLSSPKTQIVNAFSNILQTGLNPVTKTVAGGVDWVANAIGAKSTRTHFAGEGGKQLHGTLKAIPEALREFKNVMAGTAEIERLDLNKMPTGSGILDKMGVFTRLLDASDRFFRALVRGGELESLAYKYKQMGKEVAQDKLFSEADKKASYWIFRSALDPKNKTGQGAVLSWIDNLSTGVYALRKVPGMSWMIPFIQTPMNIFKQGLEFSPLGLTTLPGAEDKVTQLSKSIIGSSVFLGAAYLANVGDATWAAPSGEADKKKFYASGRLPYSMKIGDTWQSFSKLGPLSYPIAMAAALKYYTQQSPDAITSSQLEKLSKVFSGIVGFFADQSYMEQLGALSELASNPEKAIADTQSNLLRQVTPLSALQSWVARMLDPVFRKADNVYEDWATGIPGLSTTLEPYKDMMGNDSQRPNPIGNAFSPIETSPVGSPLNEQIYQIGVTGKQSNNLGTAFKSGKLTPEEALQKRQELLQKMRMNLSPR